MAAHAVVENCVFENFGDCVKALVARNGR